MAISLVVRNISANAAAPMGLRHAGDEHAFDAHIGKYVVSPRGEAKNYALYTKDEMIARFEFPAITDLNEVLKFGYWRMELK